MSKEKQVYLFSEGNASMKELLGGKGANLAEMMRLGLPVPPGFSITTSACNRYFQEGNQLNRELIEDVKEKIELLQQETGKTFGDAENPLLVSVRSGAVVSMPGMMDTILNLGLNTDTTDGLARATGDRRFALDCYRRFIQMFGEVVLKLEYHLFEEVIKREKKNSGAINDADLKEASLEKIIKEYLEKVARQTGSEFPQDPWEQLFMAIRAVFDSWSNPRARVYRKANRIPGELGTAVNVQVMVFGNMGNDSGTGVAFTRNPSTGENRIYGEYLLNAQGEDVVAGIRTPQPIEKMKEELPGTYQQFMDVCYKLEEHYRDMQDIEFTIEKGQLYLLQTRNGKRTAGAAVKIAVDMVKNSILSRQEALTRVTPEQIEQLLHRQIDPRAELEVLAKGLPASPGAASGEVVLDADTAESRAKEGKKVLLVRAETNPDDIHGIIASQGILTSRGGMTSHAAVVARGIGKPCVCGCENLEIDHQHQKISMGEAIISEGEKISLDGATGKVIRGEVPTINPVIDEDFQTLLDWADQERSLAVRTNADTPEDSKKAREWGAEGIGLCRTEHMFLSHDRLPVVQEMILSERPEDRQKALDRLLPMQREDFKGILREMIGYPVTIRLLDPPLHEFLPDREELLQEMARLKEKGEKEKLHQQELLWQKVKSLYEFNPMLGHRGCRLGLSYPEIYQMQVRAALEAAIELLDEGIESQQLLLEIMIPLVGQVNELKEMRSLSEEIAGSVFRERGKKIPYTVGTMIELPRACMTADEIALDADFFSFGTNDLTQTTFGFSRDDAEAKFLPFYLQQKIIKENPFMQLDLDGVGELVRMACKKSRETKSAIKLGICGEHGGDPSSIHFFHQVGLDYVSCSPFRVPVARLAAAQASLKER